MDRWMCLVEIVQPMWRMGEILQELEWTVLVLITKGTTTTWGIGLLDTLQKVVEALVDTRLCASLRLHDVLRGSSSRRETWTYIMELKQSKELVVEINTPSSWSSCTSGIYMKLCIENALS